MKVLSRAEIKLITGKGTNATMIAELRYLGIDHKIRSDGTPLVFESDVIQEYAVNTDKPVVLNLSSA